MRVGSWIINTSILENEITLTKQSIEPNNLKNSYFIMMILGLLTI